ncbi:hypothetical protein Tco_1256714 [Tanacetum coccineum]
MGVSHDLRGDSWGYVPRSLFWREDLDGDGESGFDFISAKDTIAMQHCGLSAKELNEFLYSYPIPLEYDVILPISTQTIFNALPGYYFKVRILRLNPFGCAKLTTFIIMCKAYDCEPSVDLFQDSIILSKYPQLLLDENGLNLKSFKDKLPPNIDENPYFQRLGRYPTSIRVFDDPIMFLAVLKPSWELGQQWHTIIMGGKDMAFRNFIYTEDDDDLAFLPKEPSPGFDTGSPAASVNTELPKDVEEPEVQHAEITTDSGETSGSSTSHVVRAKPSASKDDAPILSISDDDEGLPGCFELKDANACHLKISAITLPAWKGHLDNQMDLELLDLHDHCYARQDVMSGEADVIEARERSREEECEELRVKCKAARVKFDLNPAILVLREKISLLTADVKENKGNLDRMMLESQKWAGYQVTLSTLESKVDSLEAKKARLEAVEASLHREVEELKEYRRDVVSKVIPYYAIELVHSDELGRLVGTLVSFAITYGRCRAYEQASNDFATATFPWPDEFVAYAAASIEALLSKKPPTLQKPAPSRTQMPLPSSQKATLSSALSLNPMSPPANLVKPSSSPFE